MARQRCADQVSSSAIVLRRASDRKGSATAREEYLSSLPGPAPVESCADHAPPSLDIRVGLHAGLLALGVCRERLWPRGLTAIDAAGDALVANSQDASMASGSSLDTGSPDSSIPIIPDAEASAVPGPDAAQKPRRWQRFSGHGHVWLSRLTRRRRCSRSTHLPAPWNADVPRPISSRRLPPAPAPLVVVLHGCLEDGLTIADSSQYNALAAQAGFFVAYPEQDTLANPSLCVELVPSGRPSRQRAAGEPAIIAGIVHEVMGSHAIDTRRVFVVGISGRSCDVPGARRDLPGRVCRSRLRGRLRIHGRRV